MGQSYRDLIAWQKAMDFDMDVYRTSKAFPLVEVETQLMIAQNLSYFSPKHGKHLLDQATGLGKILDDLIGAIRPAA
jgi:hypothetical protein